MINDDNYNDDEVQSDEFSDFDQPYHETASDWFRRSARRRARRLAGVSSCSSSDESIEEGFDDGEMNVPDNVTNSNAALKPIIKWQRQYPFAAARACLSLTHSDITIRHGSTRSPRERECNKLYRVFNKLRRQQQQQQPRNDDDNTQNIDNDKLVIDSFLPRGTGIPIIDSALARETRRQGTSSSSSLVFEMTGSRRSGKTTTLVAIAARYVASTTNSFFHDLLECEATKSTIADGEGDVNHRPLKRQHRQGNNIMQTNQSMIEPRVVILDIDLCINPIKLMLAVREAVLRRFHETSVARKWIRELRANKNTQEDAANSTSMEEDSEAQLYDELSTREKEMIERTIVSCLGRINIVQPRDFTYLSLVATLEGLRQSLDNEKKDNNQKQAPTLVMIDSMSTLDAATQFQESLPAAKGSSDRNEFFRQLIRLRDSSHEVAIIGTSLTTAGRCSIWEKMVTHRVSIAQGMN